MFYPGSMQLRNGPIRPRKYDTSTSSKEKIIYEVPHDNSTGDILLRNPSEVQSLKNNVTLSEAVQVAEILTKITTLPSELLSDILQYAGIYATFSTKTSDTKLIGHIMVKYEKSNISYEYLRLSIPSLSKLNLPPGISISNKCSQLIVECSSHDQGWSSQNSEYNGTYEDSYTWSEVAVMKKKIIDNNERWFFEEVDRAMIGKNVRVDRSYRHHIKRFYDTDGFVKNIELGDDVKLYLRTQYPGWQNAANFASITVKFPLVLA